MNKWLTFICLAFSLQSFTQENQSKFSPGIKAGIVFANVAPGFTDSYGSKHSYSPRFGVTFGGRIQVHAGKSLLFMPEISLAPKGANRDVTYASGGTNEMSPALSTMLELTPNILFKTQSAKGNFIIGGGPFLAFSMDEYSEFIGKTDAGINILAGYLLPIGFSFEFNFNKGFVKQKPRNIYVEATPNLTTSYFGFCVGYAF